ncbi:hypothetical protein CQW23_31201 [Capsicum baccatum]|uniref:Non-haem dioxygenase N-terminal domain-containing protein n=1 Tax=Capsicum baccatum TaxID=33114 RepID=A0A2G2V893_CAPBA|nr:hypothetical protein CQW23_31201 [Capsicum baccatum]
MENRTLISEEVNGDAIVKMRTSQWSNRVAVISHGVTPSLLEDFKREVIELFRLPMEEKKKLWQQEDNFEGFGQAGVLSEEQKLDWNDMFTIMTLPPYTRKVDLFQKLPSKLRCLSGTNQLVLKDRELTITESCRQAKKETKTRMEEDSRLLQS